jgi:Fic family protein
MLLGEARSKCEHLAGAPLNPGYAKQLSNVYLVKGAVATNAIEGNTLTEDQVLAVQAGEDDVIPPSQEYQLQDINNVLAALTEIDQAMMRNEVIPLDRDRINYLNFRVLDRTVHEPNATPGVVRSHSVLVDNRYRGAPPKDLDHLVDRLCDWLNGPEFRSSEPVMNFTLAVIKAIVSHVYIAWIHPYGDGNGRTARLVEAQILSQNGVPLPAVNLLSDHYNKTRARYAIELGKTSTENRLDDFIAYAIEGFVDGLRSHVAAVREYQVGVAFTNYVHERAAAWPSGATAKRRRDLVLALDPDKPTRRRSFMVLTDDLADSYAGTTEKTLTRDLNFLRKEGLIQQVVRELEPGRWLTGWIQNRSLIRAWLPPTLTAGDGKVTADRPHRTKSR